MQAVTAQTLTDTAHAVTVRSERNIKKDMIVRTPYTTRSLKTFKASASRPIDRQDAVSGTVSDYLPIHDEGGTTRARKKRIPVPTNKVRGLDRKKRVPSSKTLQALGSRAFALFPTTRNQADASNWGARKTKSRKWKTSPDKIFGRNRGSRGYVAFRLSRPAMFIRQGNKLIKIRDLSLSSVKVKAKNWHTEAVRLYGTYEKMSRFFMVNADRFLKQKAGITR
jgi:hypothetical protein